MRIRKSKKKLAAWKRECNSIRVMFADEAGTLTRTIGSLHSRQEEVFRSHNNFISELRSSLHKLAVSVTKLESPERVVHDLAGLIELVASLRSQLRVSEQEQKKLADRLEGMRQVEQTAVKRVFLIQHSEFVPVLLPAIETCLFDTLKEYPTLEVVVRTPGYKQ